MREGMFDMFDTSRELRVWFALQLISLIIYAINNCSNRSKNYLFAWKDNAKVKKFKNLKKTLNHDP